MNAIPFPTAVKDTLRCYMPDSNGCEHSLVAFLKIYEKTKADDWLKIISNWIELSNKFAVEKKIPPPLYNAVIHNNKDLVEKILRIFPYPHHDANNIPPLAFATDEKIKKILRPHNCLPFSASYFDKKLQYCCSRLIERKNYNLRSPTEKNHLEKSRETISQAITYVRNKNTLLLLGPGDFLNIPQKSITRFKEILALDINDSTVKRALVLTEEKSLKEKCIFLNADLSGMMTHFYTEFTLMFQHVLISHPDNAKKMILEKTLGLLTTYCNLESPLKLAVDLLIAKTKPDCIVSSLAITVLNSFFYPFISTHFREHSLPLSNEEARKVDKACFALSLALQKHHIIKLKEWASHNPHCIIYLSYTSHRVDPSHTVQVSRSDLEKLIANRFSIIENHPRSWEWINPYNEYDKDTKLIINWMALKP